MNNFDFCTLFVSVYGFNWNRAASDLGVSRRTVVRWYEANKAPLVVLKHLSIVDRGYLPLEGIYSQWRICGANIHTPWGVVRACDVEYLQQYKWAAREYQSLIRSKPDLLIKAESDLREAIEQASRVLSSSPLSTSAQASNFKYR